MKTKDEFIRRWKAHVAGVIALGAAKTRRILTGTIEGPADLGLLMLELTETTEQLLRHMYDDLNPPQPK